MQPVANVQAKEQILPSLLDRLTNDDPTYSAINALKIKLNGLESALSELLSKKKGNDAETTKAKELELKKQLNDSRKEMAMLSASVSSFNDIRACVKRDLDWLLNANQYAPQKDLEGFTDVASAVINYGMPDLTGKTLTGFDQGQLERLLKQVVLNFEPRIIKRTLKVNIIVDKTLYDHNALAFEIEGELWAKPQPLHLHLRTEFELENGTVKVIDYREMEKRL